MRFAGIGLKNNILLISTLDEGGGRKVGPVLPDRGYVGLSVQQQQVLGIED